MEASLGKSRHNLCAFHAIKMLVVQLLIHIDADEYPYEGRASLSIGSS